MAGKRKIPPSPKSNRRKPPALPKVFGISKEAQRQLDTNIRKIHYGTGTPSKAIKKRPDEGTRGAKKTTKKKK